MSYKGGCDMKDSPILFSTDMVKAILEGRKTMTRRVIKPMPKDIYSDGRWYCDRYNNGDWWCFWGKENTDVHNKCGFPQFKCPFGQVGGILWVKETCFASRIAIEVTDIRVERLQEITEEDAIKEGARDTFNQQTFYPAVYHFQSLWASIYGKKHLWESNPWVWVISFKRVRED
jgi:hypothetical protein